jgi:hypothetical protein
MIISYLVATTALIAGAALGATVAVAAITVKKDD